MPLLLLAVRSAEARVEGEALIGRPFGVGQVSVSGLDLAIDASRVFIEEKNGRVFYPAVAQGAFGKLIGQILGGATERPTTGATIHFLFRGDEPLELTVYVPQPISLVVQPQTDHPRRFDRDLTQWWRQYNAFWRNERADDNQPPIVATYLTAMLGQRLSLEPPVVERLKEDKARTLTTQALELMAGMEKLRIETMKNTLTGRGDFGEVANLPLPPGPAWIPWPTGSMPVPPEIEPMAMHVPQDWFYARFGRFSNYLWMTHLMDEYGGDISSMVTLRSYIAPMNKRVQNQLGLEQDKLADLLGDQVISDVALVGSDTFMREGAAIGLLAQAVDTKVLKNVFSMQRDRAFDREQAKTSTRQTLQIAGREVSFYSTPDNRLRSFYAIDGDFHLVTTSRAMVEQFLRASDGRGTLGASAEFRAARQAMPVDRKDTVFAYFSTAFFQRLFSPQYQVELGRRMKAVTDLELLKLGRLAGRGEQLRSERNATEGVPYSDNAADLVAAGLLPRGFGRRADGSGPVLLGDEWVDARRGARGAFMPIPDVATTAITRGEAERLQALNAQLASQWRRMDPLLIAIQRTALDDKGRERLVIDGNINPLDETKYGWVLSMLGPPTRQMITTAQGDVIAVQAAVRGGVGLPQIPPHHLFLGVQDLPLPSATSSTGLMQLLNLLRSTPGYIGSWPTAGFLDILPFNLGGTVPDANGFSKLPFGLWRRQGGGFSVLSFDPQLLANITPQLRVVDSEIDAQLRLHVQDLSQSQIKPWIRSLYYQRGLTASVGNARFLALLNQQLHVPLEDAKKTTEDLLDAQLICPLGGEYQLVEDLNGGRKSWQSTAWANRNSGAIPDNFEAPLLKWFRGLDAHLTKDGDQLFTRIELDIERHPPPTEPKVELPSFFNLGNLFGGGQKALKAADKQKDEELPPPLPPVVNPPKAEPPRTNIPGGRDI
ncbi:MAG TPA: hypothetical protein VGI40_16480 [Pirellulaceae bacterium]